MTGALLVGIVTLGATEACGITQQTPQTASTGAALQARASESASQPSSLPADDPPVLKDPKGIPNVELPEGGPNDHRHGRPDCGVREGMFCCDEKNCGGGLRCVREGHGSPVAFVCRRATRPPPVEVFSGSSGLAGGLFGGKEDRSFGGACPAGTTRRQCEAHATGSGGHCEPLGDGWSSPSPTDCRCAVHLGVPALQGLDCMVRITAGSP